MWSRSDTGRTSSGAYVNLETCSGDETGFLLIPLPPQTRLHAVQRSEDAVGSRIDVDRRHVAPGDHAVGVDHEQRPFAGALSIPVHAVGARQLSLGLEVGEQGELDPVVLRKRT